MGKIKRTLYIIGLLILAVLTSMTANASMLIEPHLGFNVSGGGTTSGTEFTYQGSQYGLRFGGQYLGLMAGLDFNRSSYTWKRQSLANGTTNDEFSRNELGLFAGYNLPILLRAWVAYYFTNTATDESSGGYTADGDKYKGNTFELGVGYTALPFLSLNMAYRNVRIDTQELAIASKKLGSNISNHEFVLGVSTPITWL